MLNLKILIMIIALIMNFWKIIKIKVILNRNFVEKEDNNI